MQIKTGIDIIEVKRIKESIEKLGEKFLNRVFTPKEIQYCNSKNNQKYQHYAARFAAKEAVFKAISDILKDKYAISWKDIEITNTSQGKPKENLNLTNLTNIKNIKKIKNNMDNVDVDIDVEVNIEVSLSHIKEYAIANCVVVMS